MNRLLVAAGFSPPTTEQLTWEPIWDFHVGPVNLSVNRPVLLLLFGTALVMVLFWAGMRNPKLVPTGLQNVVEAGVDFVRKEIVYTVIGPEGDRFWPYITALFFFVFTLNIFEVVPLIFFPVTFRSGITWPLALLSLIVFCGVGFSRHGLGGYFKMVMLPPGAPKAIYPFLAPIEFISTFIFRPFTLSIRLLANMISGHLILIVFWFGAAYLFEQAINKAIGLLSVFNGVFGLIAFVLSIALVGLEIVIDALQAYVFAILTAVYIAGAMAEEH
jgi:F-type H+-transporting ATPase subunit a